MGLQDVALRCNFKCYWCEKPVNMRLSSDHMMSATREHLIPKSLKEKGVPTLTANVVLAHKLCNNLRGTMQATAFKNLMNGSRLNKFELWPHVFDVPRGTV